MKTQVIIVAILLSILSYIDLSAQVFGLRGGMNLSKNHEKGGDFDITLTSNSKNLLGFHIGPTLEFPVSDVFSLETGLLITTKGWKYDFTETFLFMPVSIKSKTTLYYVDIPITPKFTFDLGNAELFVLAGPYLGVGLYGESEVEASVLGESEKAKDVVTWGSGGLNRLDYGLTAGTGLQVSQMTFGVYYNYGLANVDSYSGGGYRLTNRVLNFSIGYRFIN